MNAPRRSPLEQSIGMAEMENACRIHWFAGLAILGTLLLFLGASWSSAAPVDDRLASIVNKLKDQGKQVLHASVALSGAEAQIVIECANGEVRKYNAKGQLVEVKDPQRRVTTYQDGLEIEQRDSTGTVISQTQYVRDAAGKLRETIKRSSAGTEDKLYDDQGNVIQASDAQGMRSYGHYEKDRDGHTLSYLEIDQNTGKATRVVLNSRSGEIVEKIDENGVRTRVETTRDAHGDISQTLERDGNGNEIIKKFAQGRLIEQDRNGIVTRYENVVGQTGQLMVTREQTTTLTEHGPMVETVVKKYDDSGRLVQMQDSAGTHLYAYRLRANGRLDSRQEQILPRQGTQETAKQILTTYDEGGRILGVDDGRQLTTQKYVADSLGHLLSQLETKTIRYQDGIHQETTLREYDGQGHVYASTDLDGRKTTYGYDVKGNRISQDTKHEHTVNTYDGSNVMNRSVTTDEKGIVLTAYEKDGKLLAHRERIYKDGFVETTAWADGAAGLRTAVTTERFGIRITTYLNREGEQPLRVIFLKYNGRISVTDYTYDQDRLVSSRQVDPMGQTDTFYNDRGKSTRQRRIDLWGRKFDTQYVYKNNQLVRTIEMDLKGMTTTEYDEEGNAQTLTRTNEVGFPRESVETRNYSDGGLVSSRTTDVKGFSDTEFNGAGLAVKVHRTNYHGFPRENEVENTFDLGGDLVASVEKDVRGESQNTFDEYGLMGLSVRQDIYGYPKEKRTTYAYDGGELMSSEEVDQRGTVRSQYNSDGLVASSQRSKVYGYPRIENTTYMFDAKGSLVTSHEEDQNGFSNNQYDLDELLAKSVRHNLRGHARDQVTMYTYDGEGFLISSDETDLRTAQPTHTAYDRDGLAQTSVRQDKFGPGFGRVTQTVFTYDAQGFLIENVSKNALSTTTTKFDLDGLMTESRQEDNYGLLGGRVKITDQYLFDENGHIQSSVTSDGLGTTYATYDTEGDAWRTQRVSNYGLGAVRTTTTTNWFDPDTGLAVESISRNDFGTTTADEFDPVTGLAARQAVINNYGVRYARQTMVRITANADTGLNDRTDSSNEMGETLAEYDPETGAQTWSDTTNNYGLKDCRHTYTTVEDYDHETGINRRTRTVNSSEAMGGGVVFSRTLTDAYDQDYGTPIHQHTTNEFGVELTRENDSLEMSVNPENGLNEKIVMDNRMATTTTWFDDERYGTFRESRAVGKYGLQYCRLSKTTLVDKASYDPGMNYDNGFQRHTYTCTSDASGAQMFSETWTDYDDDQGLPIFQKTRNQFGLTGSRYTTTTLMDVNPDNGLYREIDATNDLADTISLFDDKTYGTLKASDAENFYGLRFAQHTYLDVQEFNQDTGYNVKTVATTSSQAWGQGTVLSKTTTDAYDQTFGTPEHQITEAGFGIGYARRTETRKMDVNQNNGLTHSITSFNGLSDEIISVFDQEKYGTLQWSSTHNLYGLGFNQYSLMRVDAVNSATGLNIKTTTVNSSEKADDQGQVRGTVFSQTVTDEYNPYSGTPEHQITRSNFGLWGARVTETAGMDVNQDTGLNREIDTFNDLGYTVAYYDDAAYGVMRDSDTSNYFGLGYSQHTYTEIGDGDFNTDTGLNFKTTTINSSGAWGQGQIYSTTVTDGFDPKTGTATHQTTDMKFGITNTQHTWTNYMHVNTDTGLNHEIQTENAQAKTTTQYDDATYGTFLSSVSVSKCGLEYSRMATTTLVDVSATDLGMNYKNGLQRHTYTRNTDETGVHLFSETWTNYDDELGVPLTQTTHNQYGVTGAADTFTYVIVDPNTGLNHVTISTNGLGTTTTQFDPTYGTFMISSTMNNYGVGYARQTRTGIIDDGMNYANGLQKKTKTVTCSEDGNNTLSTVTTTYDDVKGIPISQETENTYGDYATRKTHTNYMTVDEKTGLNQEVQTENDHQDSSIIRTTTRYDGTYGDFVESSVFTESVSSTSSPGMTVKVGDSTVTSGGGTYDTVTAGYTITRLDGPDPIDHTTGILKQTRTFKCADQWGTTPSSGGFTITQYDTNGTAVTATLLDANGTKTADVTYTNDSNTGLKTVEYTVWVDGSNRYESFDPETGKSLGWAYTDKDGYTTSYSPNNVTFGPTGFGDQAASVRGAALNSAVNGKRHAVAVTQRSATSVAVDTAAQSRANLTVVMQTLLQGVNGLGDQMKALVLVTVNKLSASEIADIMAGSSAGVEKLLQALRESYQVLSGGAPQVLDDILKQARRLIQMDPARIMELSQAGTTGQVLAAAAGSGAALGAASSGAGRTVAGAGTAGVQNSSRLTADTNPSGTQQTSSQVTPANTSGPSTRNGAVEIEILSTGIRRTLFLNEDSDQARDVELFKFNGDIIRTHNTYVDGKLALRTETDVLQGTTTQTQYNANERPASSVRVDAWGQITTTQFSYTAAGKLAKDNATLMRGHQLMASTVTNYDANEDATTITCDRTTGFKRHSVETRTYENHIPKTFTITDNLGGSTGTFNSQGTVHTLHRVDNRGVLRVSDTTYSYDVSGDLTQAVTTDARGTTIQRYDYTGLVTFSERVETRGYPRVTYTNNVYAQGALSYAVSENDQGTRTVSYYDANGLVQKSVKTRRFGYPRTETTSGYAYDASGFLVSNVVTDERGTTALNYNYDGLAVAGTRHNLHGHGGDQALSYTYDAVGIMTKSSAVDALGTGRTDTVYDTNGLAWQVTRTNTYGLEGERSTLTTNTYTQSSLVQSTSTNGLGTLEKTYDKDGLVKQSTLTRKPAYGLGREQVEITDVYKYDSLGQMKHTEGHDGLKPSLSHTVTDYDANGDPVSTVLSLTVGLQGERVMATATKFDAGTGLPIHSEAKNIMRTTTCDVFDAVTGQPHIQQVVENYGPELGSKRTETLLTDPKNGLKQKVMSSSDLEDKTTEYDTETGGTYGIPSSWHIDRKYGYAAERSIDATRVEVNTDSGVTTFVREESTATGVWWREVTYDAETGSPTVENGGRNYGRLGDREYRTDFQTYDELSGLPLTSQTVTQLATVQNTYDAQTGAVTDQTKLEHGVTTTISLASNEAGIVTSTHAVDDRKITDTTYDQTGGASLEEVVQYYLWDDFRNAVSKDFDTRNPVLGSIKIIRDYVDNGLVPIRTAAKITYTYYEGMYTGIGYETYEAGTGIIKTRWLNQDAGNQFMQETITYLNDGNYLTGATGIREDGQTVTYTFGTGVLTNEIVRSVDDKGTTTWLNGRRQTLTGSNVVYTYTYNDDNTINIIKATYTRGDKQESLIYDKYFNLTWWKDGKNIQHNYTPVTQNKGYWTSATDSFQDLAGSNWIGTVNYDSYGFYFKSETLKNAVDKSIHPTDLARAGNLPQNILDDVRNMVKDQLTTEYPTADTFTWDPGANPKDSNGLAEPSARRTTATLGSLKAAALSDTDFARPGDGMNVEYTIGADGSTQAKYTSLDYQTEHFKQVSRYKPSVSTETKSFSWWVVAALLACSIIGVILTFLGAGGLVALCALILGGTQIHAITDTLGNVSTVNWNQVNDAFYTNPTDCGKYAHSLRYDWWGCYCDVDTYTKAADGVQWVDANSKDAQETINETAPHTVNQTVQTPFDQQTNNPYNPNATHPYGSRLNANQVSTTAALSAAAVKTLSASLNQIKGVALGGAVTKRALTSISSVTAKAVAKLSMLPGTLSTGGGAKKHAGIEGPLETSTPSGIVSPELQAELLKRLNVLQAKLKVWTDHTPDLATLKPGELLEVLRGSSKGMAKLINGITALYEQMYGPGYEKSLLNQVADQVQHLIRMDPVKVLLLGQDGADAAPTADQKSTAGDVLSRDEEGRPLEVVDAKGAHHAFAYDESGETETITDRQGKVVVKHSDANGRLLSESRDGRSYIYSYAKDKTGATQTTVQETGADGTKTYQYDAQQRLTMIASQGQKKTFAYEGTGKDEKVTETSLDEKGKMTERKTYQGGRLIKQEDTDRTTEYAYSMDKKGEVTGTTMTVTEKGQDQTPTVMTYDGNGRMTSAQGPEAERFLKEQVNLSLEKQALQLELEQVPPVDQRVQGQRVQEQQLPQVH